MDGGAGLAGDGAHPSQFTRWRASGSPASESLHSSHAGSSSGDATQRAERPRRPAFTVCVKPGRHGRPPAAPRRPAGGRSPAASPATTTSSQPAARLPGPLLQCLMAAAPCHPPETAACTVLLPGPATAAARAGSARRSPASVPADSNEDPMPDRSRGAGAADSCALGLSGEEPLPGPGAALAARGAHRGSRHDG